jgi:serine/threonine-protein kinase
MHAGLEALARKHALPATVTADLEVLLGAATITLDGYASVDLEPDPAPAEAPNAPLVADRYEDLGLIGEGAMGEVRRVRDRQLNRVLAMKVVHAPLLSRPTSLARFMEEAQATAQLQHPNIVPVHDLGRLPDGRVWFTLGEPGGSTGAVVVVQRFG